MNIKIKVLVLSFVTFALLLLAMNWGTNQAVDAHNVRSMIFNGDTEHRVRRVLAETDLPPLRRVAHTDQFYLEVSRPGLGSYFVRQQKFSITFDNNRRVIGGVLANCSWADEQFIHYGFRDSPIRDDGRAR